MSGAINENCPWSGNPVDAGSLTDYRGQVVGFCNPGCRDKFAAATSMFDAAIEAKRPVAELIAHRDGGHEVYAPRTYRDFGVLALGASRFKAYGIEAPGSALDADAALAAVTRYARACPHVWTVPESALGHVIVHRGEEADWLLAGWWIGGGILRGLVARSEVGALDFAPADSSLVGCVWELRLVEHERQAWVRHMMRETPDVDGFLADRHAEGLF
ncbi:hypothetical protein [Sphingomicrobium arenosum]|uniref:hypothetical protein n=1 Tax=Sphingomicrobium arenosum TaxID=2233861 RepID=UPI00223F7D0F|nr:hypothetical protein [Sphingomicrobium arenosum]